MSNPVGPFTVVAYGTWALWRFRGDGENSGVAVATTVPGIAAVTFANGADNIGVFTPLFRSIGLPAAIGTSIGFLALVAVWCVLGAMLGTRRGVVATLGRIDHWLVPVVFVVIGVLILVTTGAVTLIIDIVTT
jgi:cadmium resistance protein CadD (predicted permease)